MSAIKNAYFQNTIDVLHYLLDIPEAKLREEILFLLLIIRKLDSTPDKDKLKEIKKMKNRINILIKEINQKPDKN